MTERLDASAKELKSIAEMFPAMTATAEATDQFDPEAVAGPSGLFINPAVTRDFYNAGVTLEEDAGDLVHNALAKGIPPGDVIREVFGSLAGRPVEKSYTVSAGGLARLSERVSQFSEQATSRVRVIIFPSVGPAPHALLNPSKLSSPDLL